MIFLKASPDLKQAFGYLVKSMGGNVTWNGIFAVSYNKLILPGEVRSTFFDYDARKMYTNLIDLEVREEEAKDIGNSDMLSNALNMTIYAFGKWGAIRGLNVEKDYQQLNKLFSFMLKEAGIKPSFQSDQFLFYQKDLRLSYEDVIQEILKVTEDQEEPEEKFGETADEKENKEKDPGNGEEEYKLGLWHRMKWVRGNYSVSKGELTPEEKRKGRLGHDFYIVDYLCPVCKEKLFIILFPVHSEFLIETEEGGVYLSRAYACNLCGCFYTPRPQKLLQDGDLYSLAFEDDRKAFEDYMDLMGRKGTRKPNYKFNEFAAQRNRDQEPETLADALEGIDTMSEEELDRVKAKMEDHFYTDRETEKYRGLVDNTLQDWKRRKKENGTGSARAAGKTPGNENTEAQAAGQSKGQPALGIPQSAKGNVKAGSTDRRHGEALDKPGNPDGSGGKGGGAAVKSPGKSRTALEEKGKSAGGRRIISGNLDFTKRTIDELRGMMSELIRQLGEAGRETPEGREIGETLARVKQALYDKLKAKYGARMKILDRMKPGALKSLKEAILAETVFSQGEKNAYRDQIDKILLQNAGESLHKKIEMAKGKSHKDIGKLIEAAEKEDAPEEAKEQVIERLRFLQSQQGERELDALFQRLPAIGSRESLEKYYLKLKAYSDVDTSPYEAKLDGMRDTVEKREIGELVRRSNKKDRDALQKLYNRLAGKDYAKENVEPFLEKIHEKIYAMDEKAIREICPDIMSVGFDEGREAYEKIEAGPYLPELKIDMLRMLDQRLTMLKTDESVQLAKKFKKEAGEKLKDVSRFYYYDARRMLKDGEREPEDLKIERALAAYVPQRDSYEYPIVISDASRAGNGKEGFVLTPEHIFYGSLLHSGSVPVEDVEDVEVKGGLLGKGIYLKRSYGDKVKLPNGVPSKEWGAFSEMLVDFIDYLQEKPESRSVEYLAKSKHDEKCCYRCGYVFTVGNVCPRCGSKANQ